MRRGALERETGGAGGTGGSVSGGAARAGGMGWRVCKRSWLQCRSAGTATAAKPRVLRFFWLKGLPLLEVARLEARHCRRGTVGVTMPVGGGVRAGKVATNSGNVGRAAGNSGTRHHCNSSNSVYRASRRAWAEELFASKEHQRMRPQNFRQALATASTRAVSSEACAPPCTRSPRYS